MTPSQPAEQKVDLQVRAIIQPGPDGQPWVTLVIGSGILAMQLAVPPDGADSLADAISTCLKTEAATARRQRSGLILPHELNGQNPTP